MARHASVSDLPDADKELCKKEDIAKALNIGVIVDETSTNEDEMENCGKDTNETLPNEGEYQF